MALFNALRSLSLVSFFFTLAASQGCTPRPASELVPDPGFEQGDVFWSGSNSPVLTVPTYPSHSGTHMAVLTASYVKTASSPALSTTAFTAQLTSARPGITYAFKAYYSVADLSKGPTCPDPTLALGSCTLTITYAFQTIKIIPISSPTQSYIEISLPFLPSSGGRYIQFSLTCAPQPPTTTPPPQCASATLLLDDVTFFDAGNDCSWRYWGCFTDSTSFRSLPEHGTIAGWPATTTVEACTTACASQGFWYAGLEFGNECWCGNGLGGTNVTDGCTMPCSGFSQQVCGGPDRLSVWHQGVWVS